MSALDIWRRYYESLARSLGSLLARDKNLKYLVEREIKLNCASQGPLHICQSAKLFRECTHQSLIWTFRLIIKHRRPDSRRLRFSQTRRRADRPIQVDPRAYRTIHAHVRCDGRARYAMPESVLAATGETLGRCVKNGWGVCNSVVTDGKLSYLQVGGSSET